MMNVHESELEAAARYRFEHWRERWDCHPLCRATGPGGRHHGKCRSLDPPDHPELGLIQYRWRGELS